MKELMSDSVKLSISYMEIYKDEVYDLLIPRERVCSKPLFSVIHLNPVCRLRNYLFERTKRAKSLSLT